MTFRKYGRALERAELKPDPSAVVGCYSVDLYCVHPERPRCDTGQFTGETRSETLRTARKEGWYISRDEQRVLCPYHAKQVPK